MEPEQSLLDQDEAEAEAKAVYHHRVTNDLAIIQAQAQLLKRRLRAGRPIAPDDLHHRLTVVVEAVRRLTQAHW